MSHSKRAHKLVRTDSRSLQVSRVVLQILGIQQLLMASEASGRAIQMSGQCLERKIISMIKVNSITSNLKSYLAEYHSHLTFTSTNQV